MKKIISFLMCIVILCFTLVGCAEDEIGAYLPNYKENMNNKEEPTELNFYIIVGDNTSEDAKATVPREINVYLKEKYNITLNINYCLESEYNDKVIAAAKDTEILKDSDGHELKNADGTPLSNRADIVLINSYDLYNTLKNEDLLVNLTSYFSPEGKYRALNAKIESNLLDASLVDESKLDENGNKIEIYNRYVVPNNQRIGEYDFMVINKHLARDILNLAPGDEISNITSLDSEMYLKLIDRMTSYYNETASLYEEYPTLDDFIVANVRNLKGNYEDKIAYEYGYASYYEFINGVEDTLKAWYSDNEDELSKTYKSEAAFVLSVMTLYEKDGASVLHPYKILQKNYVNISKLPVISASDVYTSAYAIIKNVNDSGNLSMDDAAMRDAHYSKCMDIIYALNTDPVFKNMLQYGYVGANYKFIKDEMTNENTDSISLYSDPNSRYEMNNLYTGNMYIAYYCEDINWTKAIHNNILRQNADSNVEQ